MGIPENAIERRIKSARCRAQSQEVCQFFLEPCRPQIGIGDEREATPRCFQVSDDLSKLGSNAPALLEVGWFNFGVVALAAKGDLEIGRVAAGLKICGNAQNDGLRYQRRHHTRHIEHPQCVRFNEAFKFQQLSFVARKVTPHPTTADCNDLAYFSMGEIRFDVAGLERGL